MTEDEREELIEKIAKVADIYNCEARAALAVAEPAIREECARIADRASVNPDFETSDFLDGIAFGARVIAKAIRKGGKDE